MKQGSPEVNPIVLIGSYIVRVLLYILSRKPANSIYTSLVRAPYMRLLAKLACSRRTARTSGQYSPLRLSRSINKKLSSNGVKQWLVLTCSSVRIVVFLRVRIQLTNRIEFKVSFIIPLLNDLFFLFIQ